MLTLYTFGPIFNLIDISPFVIKTHLLLRIAKIEYTTNEQGYLKAPKGKLPFIKDGDQYVADSTFIRMHLEKTRGIDFDSHLTEPEKATAWAFQTMCEDHLYWPALHYRWLDPDNFNKGPARFFAAIPAFIRPLVKSMALRNVRKTLKAQGMGRHQDSEKIELASRDIKALSNFLGQKRYFMGDRISGVDATVYAFLSSALCSEFKTPLLKVAQEYANLAAYCKRIEEEYFNRP